MSHHREKYTRHVVLHARPQLSLVPIAFSIRRWGVQYCKLSVLGTGLQSINYIVYVHGVDDSLCEKDAIQ